MKKRKKSKKVVAKKTRRKTNAAKAPKRKNPVTPTQELPPGTPGRADSDDVTTQRNANEVEGEPS